MPRAYSPYRSRLFGVPSAPPPSHRAPLRPRVNQPVGFLISEALRPSYYFGRSHDYVYYPASWTDSASGTSYAQGYYDENGQHYDSVSFSKNGKYENVVCHCPYCGSDTVLTLDADGAGKQDLQCPHCLGPMEIKSFLDEFVSEAGGNTHSYASEESLRQLRQKKKKKKRWPWVVAILVALYLFGSALTATQEPYTPQSAPVGQTVGTVQAPPSNPELFGSRLYLKSDGGGAFRLAGSGNADKVLDWDREYESYYDPDSDCWVWCNTDVEPYVWQYWYEGISSDYGDYGWMEHYSDGWFIETSRDNWTKLPSRYPTDRLWYIRSSA